MAELPGSLKSVRFHQQFGWVVIQLVVVSICLSIIGCRHTIQEEDIEKVFISEMNLKDIQLNLSEYADSVWYIVPEFRIDTFPGPVFLSRITDEKIIIVDQYQRVFVYDFNGELLTYLNMRGRGPGEYTRLDDAMIRDNSIILLDNSRYLLFYNLQGGFLRSVRLEKQVSGIALIENVLVTVTVPPLCDIENDGYRIGVINEETGKFTFCLHKKDPEKFGPGETLSGGIAISNRSERTMLFESGEDKLYSVQLDRKQAYPLYVFEFETGNKSGSNSISKDFSIKELYETESFFFFRLLTGRFRKMVFYDKERNIGGNVVFNYSIIDNGFHNDIDGGYPFWPSIFVDDNTLATYFDPSLFVLKYSDPYFTGIDVKSPEMAEFFSSRISSINSELSNYNIWFMFVSFKH